MLLYDTQRSGNAWKVRLLAGMLGIPLQRITLSIDRGDLNSDEFGAVAPLRQVPVLKLADGEIVAESMAILYRLAAGSPWWPSLLVDQARVLTWLSFEQAHHMKPLAQLRLHLSLRRDFEPDDPEMKRHLVDARRALDMLEEQLARQVRGGALWVATTEHPSIADIALYPYSQLAPMSGVDLAVYPCVSSWLGRIAAIPGYQTLFPGRPDLNFSASEI
ncbi:glutathione S-transferase [Burkholderia lata]|uniref:Glutathione S-transferase n=1 Tax=Burkholderia lata (strain ATCC 17760 / DSM 23089 / LMG 22485 / NCIMB 9086 / R18194 / 383) TaxID=482957 RepID=A0A6P2V306_BURL3|nr:glutathione S-transferase family protein [Burkholderia lata]VWC76299.1 glutathione S-transferase [Burkholderia lata]